MIFHGDVERHAIVVVAWRVLCRPAALRPRSRAPAAPPSAGSSVTVVQAIDRRGRADQDLIPVDPHVRDDPDFVLAGPEAAGEIDAMVCGRPTGMPMSTSTVRQRPPRP